MTDDHTPRKDESEADFQNRMDYNAMKKADQAQDQDQDRLLQLVRKDQDQDQDRMSFPHGDSYPSPVVDMRSPDERMRDSMKRADQDQDEVTVDVNFWTRLAAHRCSEGKSLSPYEAWRLSYCRPDYTTDDDGYLRVTECRAIPAHPSVYFSRWSALHRPGSWEWATSWSEAVRDALGNAGWRMAVPADAPHRRVWRYDTARRS